MTCLDIKNFSQLVNHVSLYEESLRDCNSYGKSEKEDFSPRFGVRWIKMVKRIAT